MLRTFFRLIPLAGLICILFLNSCDRTNPNFVSLENGEFVYHNEPFFPVMINYVLDFRQIDGEIRLSPHKEYENPTIYESENIAELEIECRGHFQIMKDMGFNTVRLCLNRTLTDENGVYYPTDKKKLHHSEYTDEILNAIGHYLKLVEEFDLKIMLLIREPVEEGGAVWNFTEELLNRFSDNPTIFAYDFINEPLYFDRHRDPRKKDVVALVESWREMMDKHAHNQLLTVGLSEPLEVFRWDASLLPVDFLAFHTYGPLRIPSEIYWYSQYIDKPWMIGETGVGADNDSITYEEQRLFNREVFAMVRDCGGIGIGFWEFQEVRSINYEGNYTGLINKVGETTSSDGSYKLKGTIKPAGHDIKNLTKYIGGNPCERPMNYYNTLGYENFRVTGRVLDHKSRPIEGAIVRSLDSTWFIAQYTFTDARGEFALTSNDIPLHFEVVAPSMTYHQFDTTLVFESLPGNSLSIEELPDRRLQFHDISFKNYLDTTSANQRFFNFDPDLFDRAKFEADIGDLYLYPALQ